MAIRPAPARRGRREADMATRLNPYLSFGTDVRQAMEFYRDVFGGDLTLGTFGDFGATDAPR